MLQDAQSVLTAYNCHLQQLIKRIQSDYPLRWDVILKQIQQKCLARKDLYTAACGELDSAIRYQGLPAELEAGICENNGIKVHLSQVTERLLYEHILRAPTTGAWSLGLSPILLRNSRAHQLPIRQAQWSKRALKSGHANNKASIISQSEYVTPESMQIPTIEEALTTDKLYPFPEKNCFPKYNVIDANKVLQDQRIGAFVIRQSSQAGQWVISFKDGEQALRHLRFKLGDDQHTVSIKPTQSNREQSADVYELLETCKQKYCAEDDRRQLISSQ